MGWLLGKSLRELTKLTQSASLIGHTWDVTELCEYLDEHEVPNMLGATSLLSGWEINLRFSKDLKAFGPLHDLIKSNTNFQEAVRRKGRGPTQLLKHEVLAVLVFLRLKKLAQWLSPIMTPPLICAIGGHHRRLNRETSIPEDDKGVFAELKIELARCEMMELLDFVSLKLDLGPPPVLKDFIIRKNEVSSILNEKAKGVKGAIEAFTADCNSPTDRLYVGMLKATAIVADVVASIIGNDHDDKYSAKDLAPNYVEPIRPPNGLKRLIAEHSKGVTLFPFQKQMATTRSKTVLLRVGCGLGKTLAAYIYIDRMESLYHRKQAFITFPTTGNATEHMSDYVYDGQGDYCDSYALELGLSASLTHCRSPIDLGALKTRFEDKPIAAIISERIDEERGAEMLTTYLNVCTADAVLGFLVNKHRGLIALPAILRSTIVFDEIHAYDTKLFKLLLLFLKLFPNVPVMLMTASLQQDRLEALRRARPEIQVLEGPKEFEAVNKYDIIVMPEKYELDIIQEHLRDTVTANEKALWIRNQVPWANQSYGVLTPIYGDVVNVYHARFKYLHRSRRHCEVIDQFKTLSLASVLVSTQVAQQSLNLSANLLISDLAPIWDSIQRLGRAARNPLITGLRATCLFSTGPLKSVRHNMPYGHHDLLAAKEWLRRLNGRTVSQLELAETFQEVCGFRQSIFDDSNLEGESEFLSGGYQVWETRIGSTRQASITAPVILERDLAQFQCEHGQNVPPAHWLREHEVSVPLGWLGKWEMVKGRFIAPTTAVDYDYDENGRGTGAYKV